MPDDARPVPGPPVGARPPPPAVGPRPTPPAASPDETDVMAELRRASTAVTALDDLDDDDFDPAVHAERFEAVHDALVAVLADVDRT